MDKYLLSIDNGLTATKAVLFHINGRQIASSQQRTPVVNYGDFSEIDMNQQWERTAVCIRDLIESRHRSFPDSSCGRLRPWSRPVSS